MRRSHPIVFLFLILPFGIMSGYLTVTVAYLLSVAASAAGIFATGVLPAVESSIPMLTAIGLAGLLVFFGLAAVSKRLHKAPALAAD